LGLNVVWNLNSVFSIMAQQQSFTLEQLGGYIQELHKSNTELRNEVAAVQQAAEQFRGATPSTGSRVGSSSSRSSGTTAAAASKSPAPL
jgi:glucose-6-phosphate-specific signal transduction histidine kinase